MVGTGCILFALPAFFVMVTGHIVATRHGRDCFGGDR